MVWEYLNYGMAAFGLLTVWGMRRLIEAKARRREDHVNATWRAWREAFFDLIAGKPHLPSVTATTAAHPDPRADEHDSVEGST